MNSAPHMTDFSPKPDPSSLPQIPSSTALVAKKVRKQSFSRLVFWAIFPMAVWYAVANGLAYHFTSSQQWVDIPHAALAMYSLVTLYAVPWVLTFFSGLMAWGYSLSMYGAGKGTTRAFGVFAFQWLAVWAMTQASIHWHYVYFYTEQYYS